MRRIYLQDLSFGRIALTCIYRDTVKEKYGSDYLESASDVDDSEDSEDTEEDSDGEELTPAVDAAILRTLALIKKKDPVIYEGGKRVFEGVFDFSWSCAFVPPYSRREFNAFA